MMYKVGCESAPDKVGVLFAQLGTPDAPTPKALRRYLGEFLADQRVIEVNRVLWWLILHGIVLRFRPKRSARLYARIWTDEGSPLMVVTKAQTEGVKERLFSQGHTDVEVTFGMRYGRPSLTTAIDDLIERGCRRILMFPLYPQYAAATTASTYDMVWTHLLKRRWVPTLRVAEPYYRNPLFSGALAHSINRQLGELSPPAERLVLSYHGIPLKYLQKGDPYCCECTETSARFIPQLNYPASQVVPTFQSRFGKEQWLEPYTDETVEKLAKEGIKHLAIVCPGFAADCLETLDEIGNEAREEFVEHGGESLTLIRCLNDEPQWLDALTGIVKQELSGWIGVEGRGDVDVSCPVRGCGFKTFPSGNCLTKQSIS